MARAIDADKLVRIVELIDERYDLSGLRGVYPRRVLTRDSLIFLINRLPTIDPVIRCRDCAVPHNKWTGCPKLNGLVPQDNFYCAFGVRRDSDGKSD